MWRVIGLASILLLTLCTGCQQAGLSNEEIRSIIDEEISKQTAIMERDRATVSVLQQQVKALNTENKVLKSKASELENQLVDATTVISELRGDAVYLEARFSELQVDVGYLEGQLVDLDRLSNLDKTIKELEESIELQDTENIERCLGALVRYNEDIDWHLQDINMYLGDVSQYLNMLDLYVNCPYFTPGFPPMPPIWSSAQWVEFKSKY